jgi:DHA3 family macrolide efflux protein-like MFS transporter
VPMARQADRLGSPMRMFMLVWSGQIVSLLGSGMTRFALGVWVYQRTGSVTHFALTLLAGALPGIVASPVAGALVDRWDRRRVMIASDTGAAMATAVLAALLWADALQTWHVYAATAVGSLLGAFQMPAYAAATTLLVPKEQLGRANGMVQLGFAASQVVAPLVAGPMLLLAGLGGVLAADLVSFAAALATLALARVPRPQAALAAEGAAPTPAGLGSEIAEGWRWIATRPGLLSLLVLYALINLCTGTANALFTPMMLGFTRTDVLGVVMGIGGTGMLVGSFLLMGWGGPRRRIHGILGSAVLLGLSLALAGVRPSVPLVTAAYFLITFSLPLVNGIDQALWQVKTPPALQGRVFATKQMVAMLSVPVAYAGAGPLADRVFDSLLMPGAPLAATLGPVFGTGPGRGIGLLLAVLGLALTALAASGYAVPAIRRVDEDLPDWTGAESEPQAAAAPGAGSPLPAAG